MKYKDPTTGKFKEINVKVADTLPVGSEVDYNGTTIPTGWEEVDSPNEYSTEETRIGTWIDGKPLYRKTLNVKLNDDKYGDIEVTNGYIDKVKDVIHIYGTMDYSKTSVSKIPINSYIDETHYSSFYYYPTSKSLRAFLGKDLAGLKAIINVEYTKTTD